MGPLIEHASLRALIPPQPALRMHHEPPGPRKRAPLADALARLLRLRRAATAPKGPARPPGACC